MRLDDRPSREGLVDPLRSKTSDFVRIVARRAFETARPPVRLDVREKRAADSSRQAGWHCQDPTSPRSTVAKSWRGSLSLGRIHFYLPVPNRLDEPVLLPVGGRGLGIPARQFGQL